ncbi:MAG: NADH-quinone oxidoreductase subunit I [Ignavibacteriae bacterium]|nr:NADH-quinone oxidoreductase subunit I [Ignavibacteriota bacterium]MCB9206694.1 NADH-quinone oxidoreductase subunit I [Ignavibacteriales bacterium]MCB9210591.1 NADH-quinone oxidoreductase subunit I [Ignavibacteriales bacterium]MCB9219965.1 NADH-quinone oxidoreductase subunit I [Ignavibacteriales bacterium]MCB9259189.1 NADH-quinone oxidoreductase subunit I [Ignavibacteriales bacterium]
MKQYFKNTFDALYTVLVGMRITFKHLFVPSVTIQYPEVKPQMPERARNRLFVNMDDCIGCDQCSRACPVNCITIETVKATPDDSPGETSQGKKKALWVTKFDIDIAKCCFCSLCVYPCPTECINMTKVYEFSEFERDNLIYNFATLTMDEVTDKQKKFEEFTAQKEAEKLAAAKAKAEKAKQDAAKKDDKPESKPE